MKTYTLLLALFILCLGNNLRAQSWDQLTEEEKIEKLQSFKEDNQKYMRETLKLSEDQISDVENTNICAFSSLDRIATYGKDDAEKKKYAKSLIKYREKMIQAIMGQEKFEKFQTYVNAKLQQAISKMEQ